MKAEDQLMDALLKEHARKREADEALLAGIEAALDGEEVQKTPKWKRVMPLSIAALLAMTAGGVLMRQKDFAPALAVNDELESRPMRPEARSPRVPRSLHRVVMKWLLLCRLWKREW